MALSMHCTSLVRCFANGVDTEQRAQSTRTVLACKAAIEVGLHDGLAGLGCGAVVEHLLPGPDQRPVLILQLLPLDRIRLTQAHVLHSLNLRRQIPM